MDRRSLIALLGAATVSGALLPVGLIATPARGQRSRNDITSPVVPAVSGPEQVVQEQVEAYNRHDIEAFLKTYSAEIKVFDFPDTLRFSGLEAMRERYGKLF